MNILSINAFEGRNIYCMDPVVRMIVELEEGEAMPTSERPN